MIDKNILVGIICLIIGYFLGSLPSGFLAGKWLLNIDLREIGSGSTGATNVLRHIGKKAAVVVFLVDVFKGMIAVLIVKSFQLDSGWEISAGLFSLAGHIWPVWLNWRGGKAVATGLGLFLGLSWPVALASLGIFLACLGLTKIVSLASICASISLPILMFLSFSKDNISYTYLLVALISMVLVIWRHRTNIQRLIKGNEPKIGESR
ncbi:glycerol-3-phosphate 1-O-acyltransferase PlsY [Prochlorococcus sp. MIT 1223]|uniref:glycerol-3-phosphate 1-O-acyltransferase PlsY n=1 Tax=Prochlorococcus sp. MIT 1223 TaxID=3096217 RepID=UPI002A7521B3|nr:glycerol-3-phosphate 1-O-acyltransferase PlsY [Prochlorococcus sp. MIT 1223]